MDLILCHITADFDTLGAAVGLSRLHPGAKIVLTGGCHPGVQEFLALHRDEYALIERRSVSIDQIRAVAVVDTQWRDRLGKAAEWLDLPGLEIAVYDHHLPPEGDIGATQTQIESVGSTTTLIVEQLQAQQIELTTSEATVMALGIHADTGSLTFDQTTVRDAAALTWLLGQRANVRLIGEYIQPGLSVQLQDLLAIALANLQTEVVQGLTLGWVILQVDDYVPGLSNLTGRLISLTESNLLLLAAVYPSKEAGTSRLTLIGRSHLGFLSGAQAEAINLGKLLQPLGGGGHAGAAAVTLRTSDDPKAVLRQLLTQLKQQIPQPLTAKDLMSAPVRTIRPETTIAEAQRILLRYGHSGLSVVNQQDQLVGIISRRDLDIALHHGFSHAPVKGYMTPTLKTIAPDTSLPEIEALMVTYDIGRLPVLDNGELVGIVTRTDLLRQLHQEKTRSDRQDVTRQTPGYCPLPAVVLQWLRDRLTPELWQVLTTAANLAEQQGWQLYVVGGAVRDLLLADSATMPASVDIDLVVDGLHRTADAAAGVELARLLQQSYPETRLQVHGRFQTAAVLWHHDPDLDSLWIDIATARTEFYPYPAANPEVESSSIRQDLYRRDFTINAMAIRLTAPRTGELLDYFGGLHDLQTQQIRVLHANSFIEDPTRIFRAVRFAIRLGFQLEPQTEQYIRHAIASGIYDRVQSEMDKTPALQTRLKRELKYILAAPYWRSALRLLADLGALRCLHPSLVLTPDLWWQLRLVDRWLRQFDPQPVLEHWQVLLEVLIANLNPTERGKVAENLQLPDDSIDRLHRLDQIQSLVQTALPAANRPSQIVELLRQYDLPTLTLLAVQSSRRVRKPIWQYLTGWATLKPPLDGNDLRALGYVPGRQFKDILDRLLTATLDGEVSDRLTARNFLEIHFPL
jgi:tRNA nucleotidyltransferase (CCA-adding enzyme)